MIPLFNRSRAYAQRTRSTHKNDGVGFTLIEMLAVLTLAAIMAAVAVPAMQRWFESISERAQLSEVATQFQKLAARAALHSETVSLNKASWQEKLSDGQPALVLPEGWSVINEQAVLFYASGMCGGGNADLAGPQDRRVSLQIAAVSCAVSLANVGAKHG